MKTVIDIAQCHRNLKDSQESIDILRDQMKVVPFKNKPKHTIVTKTLYTMGLAYLDIGEFSYALKCFEKALNMLKEILSKR
jgi:tetratricopeptide (TPR) repeat protein